MVSKQLVVQTLQETRSPKSGAIVRAWEDTATITGRVTYLTTTKTAKDIRTYTTNIIVLTKYPLLNAEQTRLLLDNVPFAINYVENGIWNVVHCEEFKIC